MYRRNSCLHPQIPALCRDRPSPRPAPPSCAALLTQNEHDEAHRAKGPLWLLAEALLSCTTLLAAPLSRGRCG
eukprot:677212-Pleurochrysis_carterae.AAC.1